ncbi:hypothetical protein [Mesomycoplasma neurolyticum]|uniref:Uncharacterized protein n=1 Tax=Mesomycoplasma neurolyticum TaxID=2120 RepID=A0A449A6L3_9BACT|nr:hypothetical protein [Mesomycoplasma neurolyticum]VEU59488.1 Uncharacterised protein [Mesomycoplasma neurolyticum]VEU59895.1 Uncharacterised protein [Mesomycoplasma neurolyticum]
MKEFNFDSNYKSKKKWNDNDLINFEKDLDNAFFEFYKNPTFKNAEKFKNFLTSFGFEFEEGLKNEKFK